MASSPELQDALRRSLMRIEAAVAANHQQPVRLAHDPVPASVLSDVVAQLPFGSSPELHALYSVTNGFDAFGYEIVPIDRLVPANAEVQDFLADYVVAGSTHLISGPAPEGETVALSTAGGDFLLVETSGPSAGQLVVFSGADDSRYRVVGPSLQALFDGWAEIAEAGLTELGRDARGTPVLLAGLSTFEAARPLLARHGCSLAAVSCFEEAS